MGSTGEFPARDSASAAPRAEVSIEVTATPVLSYALAHNRVPVVSRLALTASGGNVRGGTVRLSVRDAEGPIGVPVALLVDLDDGRPTGPPPLPLAAARTTGFTALPRRLGPAAMLQVDQQRPAVIDVELTGEGGLLATARSSV